MLLPTSPGVEDIPARFARLVARAERASPGFCPFRLKDGGRELGVETRGEEEEEEVMIGLVIVCLEELKSSAMGLLFILPSMELFAGGATRDALPLSSCPLPPDPPPKSICSSGSLPGLDGSEMAVVSVGYISVALLPCILPSSVSERLTLTSTSCGENGT